jgi:hypothetical protein
MEEQISTFFDQKCLIYDGYATKSTVNVDKRTTFNYNKDIKRAIYT